MEIELLTPHVELLYPSNPEDVFKDLTRVERAGRICYRTEHKNTGRQFIRMLLRRGHLSVLEHALASFRIVCDRGTSHEIVRHRIASYSQESTRYVNYLKHGVGFISPTSAPGFSDLMPPKSEMANVWAQAMMDAAMAYEKLVRLGAPPELARSVLPQSTKTELVMTANYREWLHFIALRTDRRAHPQIREIADRIKAELIAKIPDVFDPLTEEETEK